MKAGLSKQVSGPWLLSLSLNSSFQVATNSSPVIQSLVSGMFLLEILFTFTSSCIFTISLYTGYSTFFSILLLVTIWFGYSIVLGILVQES